MAKRAAFSSVMLDSEMTYCDLCGSTTTEISRDPSDLSGGKDNL